MTLGFAFQGVASKLCFREVSAQMVILVDGSVLRMCRSHSQRVVWCNFCCSSHDMMIKGSLVYETSVLRTFKNCSYTTHQYTTHHTPPFILHSSYTTLHTPLINTPLMIPHSSSSYTTHHTPHLHVQISFQAQHFVNLHVQISLQAQHF